VAEDERGIAGFVVARQLVGETEILNFAVRADSRRKGTGTALLQQALERSKSFGAETVILEVRASNLAAIRFYERHGFVVAGKRPRCYTAPIEDALLLNLSVATSAGH
jgi:ribosomal-protein-alanine N-acetyltransferase